MIWGTLHGAALVVNHWWRKLKIKIPAFPAWLITFAFINISFVFFRAKDLQAAAKVFKGMFGLNGVMLHTSMGRSEIFGKLSAFGVTYGKWLANIGGSDKTYISILAGLLIATLMKNSNEIVDSLKPDWKSLAVLIIISCWTIMQLGKVSEFLYFQF